MSLQPIHQTTFDDWLDAERARPDGRTEHVAGEVFAMAGGSEEHNLIVAGLALSCVSPAYLPASGVSQRFTSPPPGGS